jgi:hypothetical protein
MQSPGRWGQEIGEDLEVLILVTLDMALIASVAHPGFLTHCWGSLAGPWKSQEQSQFKTDFPNAAHGKIHGVCGGGRPELRGMCERGAGKPF